MPVDEYSMSTGPAKPSCRQRMSNVESWWIDLAAVRRDHHHELGGLFDACAVLPYAPMLMYPPFGAGSSPNGSFGVAAVDRRRLLRVDRLDRRRADRDGPGCRGSYGPSTGASAPPWKLPNRLRSWKSSSRPSLTPASKPSTLSAPFGSTNSGLVNRLSTSVPVAFRQSANVVRGAPSQKPDVAGAEEGAEEDVGSRMRSPPASPAPPTTPNPFCAQRMLLRSVTFCDAALDAHRVAAQLEQRVVDDLEIVRATARRSPAVPLS